MIFSFAIHHWLDMKTSDYAEILNSLLEDKGYLLIECHEYGQDDEFTEVCQELENKGCVLIRDELIKDDGATRREFRMYKKR